MARRLASQLPSTKIQTQLVSTPRPTDEQQPDAQISQAPRRITRDLIDNPALSKLTPNIIQTLQSTHGNAFVSRLIQRAKAIQSSATEALSEVVEPAYWKNEGQDSLEARDAEYMCPDCGRVHSFAHSGGDRGKSSGYIQRKLSNDAMTTLAQSLVADSQNTAAVVEDTNNEYLAYMQQWTGPGKQAIVDFNAKHTDQVAEGGTKSPGKGYHAESLPYFDDVDPVRVAASQGICKRCEAFLRADNATPINLGGQFTGTWKTPLEEEIDETNPYPASAVNSGTDGKGGTRYGMTGGKNRAIGKDTWEPLHPNGW